MPDPAGQALYRGHTALAELDGLVAGDGDILLIAGSNTYPACGIRERIEAMSGRRELVRFSEFSPNPQLEELLQLRALVERHGTARFSTILALGGGTAIDLAKLIKAFAAGEIPHADSFDGPPENLWDVPLIAIPTTAGSGSEVTPFAVVYVGETKYSVEHPRLSPDVCLLIPQVLESLPNKIAAASGLDALCQGIESYWSVHSTETSREMAMRVIALAWENLEVFVNQRTPESCRAMSEAAYLAGGAIALTKTTAPHAVSYPITSRYGVQHGHAVALILAAMFPFNAGVENSETLDQRGAEHVRERLTELQVMLGVSDPAAAREAILALVKRIGLEANLQNLGIRSEADIQFIVENGFNPDRVNNNPRQVTEEALREMLHREIQPSS